MHHKLDVKPIKESLYINEPWLIDDSLDETTQLGVVLDENEDNILVYLPLELNHKAFIRRIKAIIAKYKEANEENEFVFESDVRQIIAQIEIYDQIWYVREMPKDSKHSTKAIEVIKEVILLLNNIPDGCAECFPFEIIDELKKEFLN